MATITVEPTESGIVVSGAGMNDAAARLDPLPPLKAARYLVVASDSAESLRLTETPLIDSIRPHAHSTLVALEASLGTAVDSEDEPPAKRLAAALGVTVIAPEGRFLSCDGALFAVGADNGWVAYGPLGAKVVHGRRYPEPSWQAHLPSRVDGAVQIPAGLWVTGTADASHAVHLADIAVHSQQLLVVVGSPGQPALEFTRLRDVLRALPDRTRASAVLIGYGEASLDRKMIRLLAAELNEPLRVAHGVTIAGEFVRLDLARERRTATFAKESVCTPDGGFELDRWLAPLGLPTVNRNTYRLTRDWLVDVVPAGLVVRPASRISSDAGDSIPVVAEVLTVTLCGDGVENLKRVVAPLRMLLERLRGYAPTQLVPSDRAAAQLIRNAFPSVWAPTARLALTEDGRIIAATVDENELPMAEEAHLEPPEDARGADQQNDPRDHAAAVTASALDVADIESDRAFEQSSIAVAENASRPARTKAKVVPFTASPVAAPSAAAQSDSSVNSPVAPVVGADDETASDSAAKPHAFRTEAVPRRQSAPSKVSQAEDDTVVNAAQNAATVAIASPQLVVPPSAPAGDPSDALARALRGSAATADLLAGTASRSSGFDAADAVTGVAGRGSAELSLAGDAAQTTSHKAAPAQRQTRSLEEESIPDEAAAVVSDEDAVVEAAMAPASDEGDEAANASVPADEVAELIEIDVPRIARSTAAQRHRVRSMLGARYDVASRSVSQLLAQQPGMRVSSGDRSTLLTTLAVVSVFAEDPTARYDIDFHTCLAEGLAALPTTRSIVVRGLPETSMASMNSMLYSRTPFLSAPVDAPLTGPMEALIWTTSGRRLDRLMVGSDAATDIIVPAHTPLRVLGTAEGSVRRLLLAEEGMNEDSVLTRLHDAAASRDNDAQAVQDSRWLGELLAVE